MSTERPLQRGPQHQSPPGPLHAAWSLVAGLAGAIAGLLPWLVTDMLLPLQNIWGSAALPQDMPTVLMPLGQYHLVPAAAMVVVGTALAGGAARLAAAYERPMRVGFVVLGAVAVQAVALTQSALALRSGLEDSFRAQVYLLGLVFGICAAIVVGVWVAVAIGKGRLPGATIAVAVTALALSQWLPALVLGIADTAGHSAPTPVAFVIRWLPLVILGIAVGFCAVATVGRAVASAFSLGLYWAGSAAVSAFNSTLGSRSLLQQPAEMLPAGLRAFRAGLTSSTTAQHLLVAVVVALMTGVVVWTVRRLGEEPLDPDDELADTDDKPADQPR